MQTMISNITDTIKVLNDKIHEYDFLEREINALNNKIDFCQQGIILHEELKVILIESAKVMRDKAKAHFEKIVTDALQFVTQDNTCKFIIEESIVRGKPAYEFYIETVVNGNVCKKKPEDSCGGGFIDIISVTSKIAYYKIFDNPRTMNACFILDEPAKMVSEQMSVKFAEYVKFLGKYFDIQIIMVTHNENIAAIADETFVVSKNKNGISAVSSVVNIPVSNLTEDVSNLIKENNNGDNQ